jgi:glycosyltransferase involved in cell wall biosynthesis
MKKVSIIIPCYNAQHYIDQCLHSLAAQTLGIDHIEIIVVNDASTDQTLDKLIEWEKRYPQSIAVINCEKNGRQGTARNIGLSYANADYISFIDADDWMEESGYEQLYKKAIKYNCDAVAAGYKDEYTRVSSPMGANGNKDQFYIIETDSDRGGFVGVDFGHGILGNLYRKEMLLKNHITFPEGYFYEDDYWFVLTMHYIHRAYIIGEDFYHYYLHPDSTIHKHNSKHQLDRAIVEELKLNELISRGIFQRFPVLYEHEFIQHYYLNMLHVLFTQFDLVDFDTICQLHHNTRKLFPTYRDNLFIQRILAGKGGLFMKKAYEYLAAPITKSHILELKELCVMDAGNFSLIRI